MMKCLASRIYAELKMFSKYFRIRRIAREKAGFFRDEQENLF